MVTATIIPDRVMDGMSVGRWLSFGVCLCVLGRVVFVCLDFILTIILRIVGDSDLRPYTALALQHSLSGVRPPAPDG